jgi:hypothetical protein
MSDFKRFSFADVYGLSLIAKDPTLDWRVIIQHLGSDDARDIAKEIINPGSGSREARTVARGLRDRATKLETYTKM